MTTRPALPERALFARGRPRSPSPGDPASGMPGLGPSGNDPARKNPRGGKCHRPYPVAVFESRVCVILQSDAELLQSRLRYFRSAEIVFGKQQHRIRELPARRVIG
jgi:hypothetical protein